MIMETKDFKKRLSEYEMREENLLKSAKELLRKAVKDNRITWSNRDMGNGNCPQIRAEYNEDAAWIKIKSVELDNFGQLVIVGKKDNCGAFREYDYEELDLDFFDTNCYLNILREILK